MRIVAFAVGAVLAGLSVSAARAEAPNAIAALLGPSVGFMMAQSEICGWDLKDKIHAAYQKGFAKIGMTDAQESAAWEQAAAREAKLMSLPEKAKDSMKGAVCTSAARADLEKEIAD